MVLTCYDRSEWFIPASNIKCKKHQNAMRGAGGLTDLSSGEVVKLPCTHTSRPRKSMLRASQILVIFNLWIDLVTFTEVPHPVYQEVAHVPWLVILDIFWCCLQCSIQLVV